MKKEKGTSILAEEEMDAIIEQLPQEARLALAEIGRRLAAQAAGRAKSERKAAAARANGAKGGRPRKRPPQDA